MTDENRKMEYMENRWKRRRKDLDMMTQVGKLVKVQKGCAATLLCIWSKQLNRAEENTWGGRVMGTKNYRRGQSNWIKDYLGTDGSEPTYPAEIFRRRFAIPRTLYRRIKEDLLRNRYENWHTKMIGGNRPGKPTDIKILFCLRRLSEGNSYDSFDDQTYISEETGRQYFRTFCEDIIDIYGEQYLFRWPTALELQDISERYSRRGFPGCGGALDCMKLFWKNCPIQLKGQHLNHYESHKMACVQAEAWADEDLYCWHWNCGRPGTNNDINVLMRSRLFKDMISERFIFRGTMDYNILPTGRVWTRMYLLSDGIYPNWGMFAKPIKGGETVEERRYSGNQEAVRKDVERLFGVLQSRFEILRREMRGWDVEDVVKISQVCVIMHNMIVRMQQNGDFREEAGGQDLIREFYNTDMESTRISREEYAQNRIRNRSGTIRNWQEEVDRMVLMEQLYTGRYLFFEREDELIELCRRRRRTL